MFYYVIENIGKILTRSHGPGFLPRNFQEVILDRPYEFHLKNTIFSSNKIKNMKM